MSPAPSPPPGGEGITQERGHQEARVVGSRLALPSRRDAQSRRGAPSVSAAALTAAVSVGSGIDLPRAGVRTGSAELLRRRFCVSAFRRVAVRRFRALPITGLFASAWLCSRTSTPHVRPDSYLASLSLLRGLTWSLPSGHGEVPC